MAKRQRAWHWLQDAFAAEAASLSDHERL